MRSLQCCAVALATAFLAGALDASPAAPAAQQPTPPQFVPVREYMRAAMASARLPSVAVAVSQHGKIIWEDAVGYADLASKAPATVHTRYGLASVTKILTATSTMILSEQGKIDIDRPIDDYLGAVRLSSPKWNVAEATVRRVATHTSGLTTYDSDCYADEPDCDRSGDDMISHYGVVFWRPGDHFDYSNLGYGVLDQMVAHVSGQSFASFLATRIFAPLGMNDCTMDETPGVAQHYDGDRKPVPPHQEVAQGASSAACSVDSLIRFGMFALKDHVAGQRAILGDSTIDAMRSETVHAGGGQRYGIGWWVDDHQHGIQNIFDQGGTSDTTALLDTIPSQDIAIAVLTNTGDPVAGKIADRILAAMIPAYAADLAKSAEPPAGASAPKPVSVGRFAGTWTGAIDTWRGKVPVTFVVADDGSSQAAIGSEPLAPARHARLITNGIVLGAMGDVQTPDADRRKPYRLGFELYPDADGLYGAVTTWQLPGARDGGLFSYWVRLKKS